MSSAPARAPDLLAWPEVKAAQDRAREADEEWRRAHYRAHHAPRGQSGERKRALSEAAAGALRAAVELRRLREGAP